MFIVCFYIPIILLEKLPNLNVCRTYLRFKMIQMSEISSPTTNEFSSPAPNEISPSTTNEIASPTTNKYSLRTRRSAVINRDYSPPAPARKRQKLQQVQTTPRKTPTNKKTAAATATKFAVPPVEDFYFNSLKSGKSPTALIEKWIRDYYDSPDQAIVQFLQLIVASCGCSGKLDANMVHNMEMKTIITNLSEFFDKDANDYPIMLTSPQWKKFRSNLGEFFTLFVVRGKGNIIYDVTLMDNLIQLLTNLSESTIRAFRHTATFAAMKMSTSLVDVVVELVESREKNAMQIETEKTKLAQMGQQSERLEILLQQKTELDGKIDELSAMIQYLFRSVFVHRYKDVVTDIRTICITELGNWIRAYPQLFLDDSYLKYFGWSLCDKHSEVRLRVISALLPLYENHELVLHLELFTSKFKDRLSSMAMDVEMEVASKACQLLTHIYRAFPTLLTNKDYLKIYKLVYCNNRQLAVAASEFVIAKLFGRAMPGAEGEFTHNQQLIKDLVAFYKDGKVHQHPSYLVDSFIDNCPILKDWPTMVHILLSNENYENDSELVAIMCAAVKQAATGEHPHNRIVISIRRGPGAGTEKKDLRLLREERMRITEVFIPTLPRLLNKFIADQEKLSSLLDIFPNFELELYSAGRYEQPLNELMQLFERIVEQYSNEEIIKQLALIFLLMNSDLAVAQFTETSRFQIIDGIADQLKFQLQQVQQGRDENVRRRELDNEDQLNLLSTYRKLSGFAAAIDVTHRCDFFDQTISLMNTFRITSDDLVDKAVILCFLHLSWGIRRIVTTPDEEAVETLRRRRDQFIRLTRGILRDMASCVENSFNCLCDTLILFNWKLAASYGPEHPIHILAYKPDRETINFTYAFVLDNVFVEDDAESQDKELDENAKTQLLTKKRNILVHYTKLFTYGLIPIIDIAGIFRFFTRFYSDFGDIFKHLMQECRKLDKATTAKAIVKALIFNYEELKMTACDANGIVDSGTEQFHSLRDLAKRFALSFGVDNIKNRDAMAMVHHDGIKYALQLDTRQNGRQQQFENFPFFEILQEFSPKLHRQDKLAVLRYLDKNWQPDKEIDDANIWGTFQLYRSSLAKAE